MSSRLNFESIEGEFWRLYVLGCCCAANKYTAITDIFLRFQTEEHVLRVNKCKITDENTFNEDHFEICDQCFNS